MRIFLLTALTMLAFASNSILNRMALADGGIDALSFGTVRLIAGAVTLVVLSLVLRGGLRFGGPGRVAGVLSLLIYMYGFSTAYVSLDAGLGALILFGVVQITMFGGGLMGGERPPLRRWLGAALAFVGLVWLLWPGGGTGISLLHGVMMGIAGIGWGVYSLAGRGASDPLQATAANFVIAAPLGVLLGLMVPVNPEAMPATTRGLALAMLAGSVTSGMGYALWYTVLPRLASSVAAVAQLTVPVIAMLGGMMFLSEALTLRFALASVLVLGGVALSVVRWPQRRIRSSGS